VKPQFSSKPGNYSSVTIEGTSEEILEKLKKIPADQVIIAIFFQDAESYYTQSPVYRLILSLLPEIISRQQRRQELLLDRLLFSLTAELPITVPRRKAIMQVAQREAERRLGTSGRTMPDLPDNPGRRVPRK
jgi:ABC-type uncharacterized transport system YnjBCD ATPase subunit